MDMSWSCWSSDSLIEQLRSETHSISLFSVCLENKPELWLLSKTPYGSFFSLSRRLEHVMLCVSLSVGIIWALLMSSSAAEISDVVSVISVLITSHTAGASHSAEQHFICFNNLLQNNGTVVQCPITGRMIFHTQKQHAFAVFGGNTHRSRTSII